MESKDYEQMGRVAYNLVIWAGASIFVCVLVSIVSLVTDLTFGLRIDRHWSMAISLIVGTIVAGGLAKVRDKHEQA